MATKIEPNKIYHTKGATLAAGSFHVIGGTAKIYACNVTEYTTDGSNRLIVPTADKFVETGDEMAADTINLIAGMPEFVMLKGSFTEAWVKMGIDSRIDPVEAE